jgi:hypothetical protein
MIHHVALYSVILVSFLRFVFADPVTILWTHNAPDSMTGYESFSPLAPRVRLAPVSVYLGTFGNDSASCHIDVLSVKDGHMLLRLLPYCQCSNVWGDQEQAFGMLAYNYPTMSIEYYPNGVFGGVQWRQEIDYQFYYAIGEWPLILRDNEMLIWGDNITATHTPSIQMSYSTKLAPLPQTVPSSEPPSSSSLSPAFQAKYPYSKTLPKHLRRKQARESLPSVSKNNFHNELRFIRSSNPIDPVACLYHVDGKSGIMNQVHCVHHFGDGLNSYV